ncbi:MAG: hypothetical protein JW822_14030 [Spirochaetales bacterium]|nr:hypothetical protein [Spirochaetales bacterium]
MRELVKINGRNERADSWWIAVSPKANVENWQELDKLGALREIMYEGNDENVIEYLESRRLIKTLKWSGHNQNDIDIRKTHLQNFAIEINTGTCVIRLNKDVKSLEISGSTPLKKIHIDHPQEGRLLRIYLDMKDQELPDFNLPRLTDLGFKNVSGIDIQSISSYYPRLRSLRISGVPGNIRNIHMLDKIKTLESVFLHDIFGFRGDDFPDTKQLPDLYTVYITSFPAHAKKTLQEKLKDCPNLHISKARSEDWLEANMNNPFRGWDGREGMKSSCAKTAFNAYKQACSRIMRLLKTRSNDNDFKEILSDFVQSFNKIHEKQILETIEREEVGDVYALLLEKAGHTFDQKPYTGWFDQWRDF